MKRMQLVYLLGAVVVTMVAAGAASAQDSYLEDFSTQDYMHVGTALWDTTTATLTIEAFTPGLLGVLDTPGDARGLAVSGDLVLVADGTYGLRVVDVTDPSAPALQGGYDTAGLALRVAVDGNLAFVADSQGGLVVVDVSNPASPALVAAYATPGVATGVAVAGDYAYVADGLAGLEVIDISTPSSPVLVGTFDTSSYANDVVVANEVAYVADGLAGIATIQVSQPAVPVLLGTYDTTGYATNLALSGTMLYVADGTSGVTALDVTDPATPLLAGSFADYPANDVAVTGNVVCTAAAATGLVETDFTDPAAPALIGIRDGVGYGWGVAVDGTVAYVDGSTSGLASVEIMRPLTPTFRGALSTAAIVDLAVSGDWAAAATTSPSGLEFLDLSTPYQLVERSSYPLSDPPEAVVMDGTRVVVAGGLAGVLWIDAADPTGLVGWDTPGYTVDVAVSGGLAYAADTGGGLVIYDMTNLTLVGQYSAVNDIVGVAVAGNIAYVSEGAAGVVALDITDPTKPQPMGTCATPGPAGRLVVAGDHAYVAVGTAGLAVLDVSDASAMSVAATLAVGDVVDVDRDGNRVYCLLSDPGVAVVDVTDPAAPFESPGLVVPGMSALAAAGDYLYVGYGSTGGAVRAYVLAQHDLALESAYRYSAWLPLPVEAVRKVRLTATQTGTVSWQVHTGSNSFVDVDLWNHPWILFTGTSSLVQWRADLAWVPYATPVVDSVLVEVLHEHPDIMSVTDVGNDQGRQVSLDWCRSAFDFPGETNQVVEYAVYRRIDNVAKSAAEIPVADLSGLDPAARDHAEKMQAAGWHFLVTVPVRTEDRYAVVVPTLVDSTIAQGQRYSTFMVSALTATPGLFFDSPPDSGYSVDNLAPGVPQGIVADYQPTGVALDWQDAPEADFRYYRVYRGTDPDFTPSPQNLLHEVATSAWTDPTAEPWGYYYKITVLDFSGNESGATSPASVSGVGTPDVPLRTALLGAAPNPFNPATTLSYEIERAGHVRLKVFDPAGRLVRTLVDGHREPGRHTETWNGRDEQGRMSSAGVYLYRLEAGAYTGTRRLVLIK